MRVYGCPLAQRRAETTLAMVGGKNHDGVRNRKKREAPKRLPEGTAAAYRTRAIAISQSRELSRKSSRIAFTARVRVRRFEADRRVRPPRITAAWIYVEAAVMWSDCHEHVRTGPCRALRST